MISGLVLKERKGLGHLVRLGDSPILLKEFALTAPERVMELAYNQETA
jgi:hypothetical protein